MTIAGRTVAKRTGRPTNAMMLQRQLSLTTQLLQRMANAQQSGLTFDGKRDLGAALGYKKELCFDDYEVRAGRNGIAKQVVEAFPVACWRGDIEVFEDDDPNVETVFEQCWKDLKRRLKVFSAFRQADIQSGFGKYASILIGVPTGASNADLAQPLPPGNGTPDNIRYFQVFNEKQCFIDKSAGVVTDFESERFGWPEFYTVKLPETATNGTRDVKVHWTRIIHIAEGDEIFHEPRMKPVWNWLDDLDKVVGGGSEATWQTANKGYQFDLDSEQPLEEPELKEMQLHFDEFMHGQRRYIRTRKVNVTPFESQTADFSNQANTLLSLIAGTTRIPKRILMGSESAELASTQDRRNFDRAAQERRDSFCSPVFIDQLTRRLQEFKYLPKVEQYQTGWPEEEEMTMLERADVATKWADLNTKAGELVVTGDEIRDRVLGLEPLQLSDTLDPQNSQDPNADPNQDPSLAAAFEFVEKGSASRPWRAVHKAADAQVTSARDIARRALTSHALNVDGLVDAFERSDREHADFLVMAELDAVEEALSAGLREILMATLLAAAKATQQQARRAGGYLAAAAEGTIDDINEHSQAAIAWVDEHVAEYVVGISELSRVAIRNVISKAFSSGLPPRESAKLIAQIIGLTGAQTESVVKFRSALIAAEAGDVVRAGTFRVKVPTSGVTGAFIETHVDRLAERMLRRRALNIARTETLAAANAGQTILWRQAELSGKISHLTQRVWILTPDDRLCPQCAAMSGQVVGLNQPFLSPGGAELDFPPLHPSCRCATGLVEA